MARTKTTTANPKTSKSDKAESILTSTPIAAARGRRARPGQEVEVAVTPAPELTSEPPLAPAPVPQPDVASGSKLSQIIVLLRRPQGATVAELMQLTGWLSHSVRGALSGALKRKMGLAVGSSVDPNRGRVYRIAEPAAAVAPPISVAATEAPRPDKRARARRKPDIASATA